MGFILSMHCVISYDVFCLAPVQKCRFITGSVQGLSKDLTGVHNRFCLSPWKEAFHGWYFDTVSKDGGNPCLFFSVSKDGGNPCLFFLSPRMEAILVFHFITVDCSSFHKCYFACFTAVVCCIDTVVHFAAALCQSGQFLPLVPSPSHGGLSLACLIPFWEGASSRFLALGGCPLALHCIYH